MTVMGSGNDGNGGGNDNPPLPIRGEDAANAAGEGTAVGRAQRRTNEKGRGANAPRPPDPRGPVIPAKAGTYWRPSFPRSGNLLETVIPAKAGTYWKANAERDGHA